MINPDIFYLFNFIGFSAKPVVDDGSVFGLSEEGLIFYTDKKKYIMANKEYEYNSDKDDVRVFGVLVDNTKPEDGYDGWMDEECVALCDALNKLPGVETIESCCGHLKNHYRIWFRSNNHYSNAIIARAFDRRYNMCHQLWRVCLDTCDMERNPQYDFMIESEKPYDSYEDMNDDLFELIRAIEQFSGPDYDAHFKKLEYCS